MDREKIWKKAFGSVTRGKKFTRFCIGTRLNNGLLVEQVLTVPNNELDLFDHYYAWVLDQMVATLELRIAARV